MMPLQKARNCFTKLDNLGSCDLTFGTYGFVRKQTFPDQSSSKIPLWFHFWRTPPPPLSSSVARKMIYGPLLRCTMGQIHAKKETLCSEFLLRVLCHFLVMLFCILFYFKWNFFVPLSPLCNHVLLFVKRGSKDWVGKKGKPYHKIQFGV